MLFFKQDFLRKVVFIVYKILQKSVNKLKFEVQKHANNKEEKSCFKILSSDVQMTSDLDSFDCSENYKSNTELDWKYGKSH